MADKGDTLWGLAETHLGDGYRWQEIAELNQGRVMSEGRTFNNPRSIEPGWELLLPADARNIPNGQVPGSPAERVVESGDTLSGIALETAGDAEEWQALYEANKDVVGSDPDLIYPGQVLVLPGTGALDPATETDRVHRPEQEHPGDRSGADGAKDQTGQDQPQTPAAPTTPAEPSQEAPAEDTQNPTGQHEAETAEADDADSAEGINALRALLASAVCLSAGSLGLVVANRRRQFRRRRIGRTIASTPGELLEVEQAILEHGSQAQEDVEFLDLALRHVAASCKASGAPLPQLGAAVLGEEDLTLLFTHRTPGPVPEGWTATDDTRAWMLPRWTFLEQDLENQPAPYPALVSVGLDEAGRTWLPGPGDAGYVRHRWRAAAGG